MKCFRHNHTHKVHIVSQEKGQTLCGRWETDTWGHEGHMPVPESEMCQNCLQKYRQS